MALTLNGDSVITAPLTVGFGGGNITTNVAAGYQALNTNTSGTSNTAVGYGCVSGNFSGSVILGRDATATASNQFVVGSATTNAGTIATEVVVSDTTWAVRINGTAYKILLKA